VAVLAAAAVAGLLGGYLWLKGYLSSEGFRKSMNRRVSEALEAEARFERFDWDGMMVRVPRFDAYGSRMIDYVEMEDFETEVRMAALLRRKLEASEVHVRRLHAELDATREAPEIDLDSGGDGAVDIAGVTIAECSGRVALREEDVSWRGIRARFSQGRAPGTYEAILSRGRLATPLKLFPDPRLKEARLRYADGSLFVTESHWGVFDSGRLAMDGEVRFRSGRYVLSASLSDVQCEEVLPDDWKKRLRGELSSDFTVEGRGGDPPVITGDIELSRGYLTALPILDRIAAYTDIERFRRLALREARLKYRDVGERLDLTEIVVASEGLVRVEGRLSIVEGRLDGQLEVGIPPGTLAHIPGAETKVFLTGKSGMLWTPVAVSGTTSHPKEDLSNRLFAAAGERMIEIVAGQPILKHSGRPVGEAALKILEAGGEMAEAGARVIGEGSAVVEEGAKVVREGVNSLLNGVLGGSPEPPPGTDESDDESEDGEPEEEGDEAPGTDTSSTP